MIKLLGLVFLVLGGVLLYYGWRSHEAAGAVALAGPDATIGSASSSRSLWLLGLGVVTAIWGLFALLRRNVM